MVRASVWLPYRHAGLAAGAMSQELRIQHVVIVSPERPQTRTIEGYARIYKVILGGRVIDPGELAADRAH